jgi:hypothetical protein
MADSVDTIPMADNAYRRDLGDGLLLRWSTAEDVEQVAALYAHAFRDSAEAPLNWHVPHWTRDLFSGRHPYISPHDFAVVEDTTSHTIVASACLLGYTIAYEGISLPFGRPEVVASMPDYRDRGLIRAIFELIHAKSEARGDLLQGITGIAYYYRQFGYEYAAPDGVTLTVQFSSIPQLKPDAPEPFTLRAATIEDIPLLQRLMAREQALANAAITTPLSADYIRWAIADMRTEAVERWRLYLILDASAHPSGYLRLSPARWGPTIYLNGLALDEGVPLTAALPSVLRGAQGLADTVIPARDNLPPVSGARIHMMGDHPLRAALEALAPVITDYPFSPYPYLWYIRAPDLPRLIQRIAPALERRLAASAQAGYTGELTLNFYRGGLRLAFEQGKLTVAEDWRRPLWGDGKAGYPPLVFLQQLCGYRSLAELRNIYPDVWAEGDAAPLLDALFPKRPSFLLPLD